MNKNKNGSSAVRLTVVGSISTDFVVSAKRRPLIGETVVGEKFMTTFGGKGANQAVAGARLGANVSMAGMVGEDQFGEKLIRNLNKHTIDTSAVEQTNQLPSGSAHITIADGDNTIIYVPGANSLFDLQQAKQLQALLKVSEIVILQNELPLQATEWIISYCFMHGVHTIYNPAPARTIDSSVIDKVTYLTPNESEFRFLFPNLTVEEGLMRFPNKLVLTSGSKGIYYSDGKKIIHVPSYQVDAVDTTGAGDTFNGALAVALSSGSALESAIRFGNLAAALSITKFGAQSGMPTLEELKKSKFYKQYGFENF